MELEFIFTELHPFNLVIFGSFFCTIGYGVGVINFSFSSQWLFLKLCRHICGYIEDVHVGF